VSVEIDAGDNAAAAKRAADELSATTPAELESALGLTTGSVSSVTRATVAVETAQATKLAAELAADLGLAPGSVSSVTTAAVAVEYGGVELEKRTVSWGFDVAEYDPATSPAAYAAALAAKMGRPFTAADFTVTAVQKADGTWSVSVEIDAGDNAAAAKRAADDLSATTPAELESALGLTTGSVSSIITRATVAVETAQASVSWSFDIVGDSYDPAAYAAALAAALGPPIKASDVTVTAVQGPGGIWSVSVVVSAGNDGAAALRAAAVLSSMTPARLAEILGAADGSVSSIGTASVEVQYGQSADSKPPAKPPAGLVDSGASAQTTADEGGMIGGIIGGAIFILFMLALVYVLLKKRDEKQEAAAWLKSEKATVAAAPMIVTETPGELRKPTSPGSPKASPALQSWLQEAGEDEEANFSGDDDEPKSPRSPGSPKSPQQIFV
jgi:hypothetical protein